MSIYYPHSVFKLQDVVTTKSYYLTPKLYVKYNLNNRIKLPILKF